VGERLIYFHIVSIFKIIFVERWTPIIFGSVEPVIFVVL